MNISAIAKYADERSHLSWISNTKCNFTVLYLDKHMDYLCVCHSMTGMSECLYPHGPKPVTHGHF